MTKHDPIVFANGLSLKLAARSRHVCVFVGAGASKACGLSDIAELQKKVREGLVGAQLETFDRQLAQRNLEGVLTRIRRIAGVLGDSDSEVDGLDLAGAKELDRAICRRVVEALDTDDANLIPMLQLAAWIARSDYHLPIEVFTVNYDLLIEAALEQFSVPWFDGFVGSSHARFRVDLVEAEPSDSDCWLPPFVVRLWKLHGSVNWCWSEEGDRTEVVRRTPPDPSTDVAAIYPSDAKYDESRRVPFVVLQDRLRRALHKPESLTLITGYSFRDHHLNEMLFDAARRRPRSEIVAFCFDEIPENLSNQATITPNLQVVSPAEAIIGGIRGAWSQPLDAPEDLWNDDAFALGDFANLTRFLARSFPPEGELQARLTELIAKAAEGS